MDKVDYIVKSSNELPYLKLMLESLYENNKAFWDKANIIVFANRCTDGTKDWCDANKITCYEEHLPGLYSIWNYGASITKNNWLIFSASDFVLLPGFWEEIEKAMELYPDFYHYSGTCIDNGISYPHPDIPERRWYNRDCGDNWKDFDMGKLMNEYQQIQTIEEITQNQTQYCPFICTREHYNFLNGFDTKLGDYPSDVDHNFIMRGQAAGRLPCIVNNAYFYHFGKKSLLRRDDLAYDWKEISNL